MSAKKLINLPSLSKLNQRGIVSLLVTIMIMMIMSLVTLGFAQQIRREQRQALDRQLNTAAFYAAESGLNYALNTINVAAATASPITAEKTVCPPGGDFDTPSGVYVVSPSVGLEGITFSCLLVDPSPQSLEYRNIDSRPTVIPVVAATGDIDTITISWESTDGGIDFGCPEGNLPASGAWSCSPGLLRVDLVPTDSVDRASLNDNQLTAFLFPSGGSGALSYDNSSGLSSQPATESGECLDGNTPRDCEVEISVPSGSSFHLRLRSLYNSSTVTIRAYQGASQKELVGAQTIIDVTGKAEDVLRRIQARVRSSAINGPFPDAGVFSMDTLCKRYKLTGSVTAEIDTPSPADAACDI